jgi:hypothetical protein
MKKIKNKKTKLIAIIIFFIIIIISAILLSQSEYIEDIYSKVKSQKVQEKDITYECYGWQAEGADILITFSDYENGISKVETPDGQVIETNGKNVVAIDYVAEFAKTYLFKMYDQNGELYQKNIVLDIDIIIAKTGEGYGYKKISINYKDEDNSDFSKYYKIGENGEWKTYEDTFLVWDYDVTYQNLANTDETVTIYAKMEDVSGYSIETEQTYKIDTSIKEKVATLEAESLIKAVEDEDFSMGMFIYCTGTITNKGTISMTARGAKAEGQNVYLWKNKNNKYEYVPKEGSIGGEAIYFASYNGTKNGLKGEDGVERGTGGGGSGAVRHWINESGWSGKGGTGTSYSGGAGGGGNDMRGSTISSKAGSSEGGARWICLCMLLKWTWVFWRNRKSWWRCLSYRWGIWL